MICEIAMTRDIVLHPSKMKPGGGHNTALVRELKNDIGELKCSPGDGYYYIGPTRIERVGDGRVVECSGEVAFSVDFKCLVFRLSKGEVAEMEVIKVSRGGVEAACGPFTVFVHQMNMSGAQFGHTEASGDYFSFPESGSQPIAVGTVLRARILAFGLGNELERELLALGTIDGHYLGPIDSPDSRPWSREPL